jgi:hypothetical protein
MESLLQNDGRNACALDDTSRTKFLDSNRLMLLSQLVWTRILLSFAFIRLLDSSIVTQAGVSESWFNVSAAIKAVAASHWRIANKTQRFLDTFGIRSLNY